MKKIIFNFNISFLILMFVFPSSGFSSEKLLPLSQLVLQEQSLSRHLYVNERCAGLNQSIAGRFNNSSNTKAKKLAGALFLKAANHSMYAMSYANKMGKNYTQQQAVTRSLLFAKIYQKEMDKIYDMTGSAIGGIVLEDQTVCDKIDSNGGSILLENKNSKENNSKKKFSEEAKDLENQFPLEKKEMIKQSLQDEPNRCLISQMDSYKNGFVSSKTLILQFNNDRPSFAIVGELAISKEKVLKPYLFLYKKLDKWMTDEKLLNTFFTNRVEGIEFFMEYFQIVHNYYDKITKNQNLLLSDVPIMTFKDNETGNLYNIDLFFEKFTEFSNCFTRVSQENMKRFKERN